MLSSRKLLMYAPQEEQPKQSLTREEMTEVCVCVQSYISTATLSCKLQWKLILPFAFKQREQIIFDHFSEPVFVNQFIEFLSLEERKGKDKFSPRRFCLFKVSFLEISVVMQKLLRVQKNFSLFLSLACPGIISQFQRHLPSAAATSPGMPRGRLTWEQAALCCRDHLWID